MNQRNTHISTLSTSRLGQVGYGIGGGSYRIIATAASTQNTFFALENIEVPDGGTPLHCHTREDEFFHVVEGELTLFVQGKTVTLAAGQSLFAPRGIPHCFKNCSSRPVKFLVFCTPPDIEAFFDYGLPIDGKPPTDQQLMQRIVAMAPKFGLEVLGPSPL